MPSTNPLILSAAEIGERIAGVSIGSIGEPDPCTPRGAATRRLTAAGGLSALVVLGGLWIDSSVGVSRLLASGISHFGLSSLQALALSSAMRAALFVAVCGLLGLTAAVAISRHPPVGRKRAWLGAVAIACFAELGFLLCRFGARSSAADLVLALLAASVGMGLALAARRGAFSVVKYLLGISAAVGVVTIGLLLMLSDVFPTLIESSHMTESDRKRLGETLIGLAKAEQQPTRLILTQADANLLSSRWLDANQSDAHVEVRLDDNAARLLASVNCPPICFGRRYLNLELEFVQAAAAPPPWKITVSAIRVGGVELPQLWTTAVSDATAAMLEQQLLEERPCPTLVGCQIRSGGLELIGDFSVFNRASRSLIDVGWSGNGTAPDGINDYCETLMRTDQTSRSGDQKFQHLLVTAFRRAKARTQEQPDRAVDENRLALIAFGIVVGNPSLRSLASLQLPGDSRQPDASRVPGVTLRGRNDWARHFATSAALGVAVSMPVSRFAGILKEEWDAGQHGSGFSFADLLADEAGIRFTSAATRDQASALRMQQQLSASVPLIDDLFPPAADLPEGIREQQLQDRFGGIGGAGYQQLAAELSRRLDGCPLLQ